MSQRKITFSTFAFRNQLVTYNRIIVLQILIKNRNNEMITKKNTTEIQTRSQGDSIKPSSTTQKLYNNVTSCVSGVENI